MFDITKLLLRIPNALTKDECEKLIQEYDDSLSNIEVSIDSTNLKQKEATFKAFEVQPYSPTFDFIKQKTKKVVNRYTKYLASSGLFHKLMKENFMFSHKYRILKYGTEAKIHPHTDHSPFTYGSITFNLNDDYEGGEFSFFHDNYRIKLKQGEAIVFPADYFWIHEVKPITKGVRYSLNSFLGSCPHGVRMDVMKLYGELMEYYFDNTPLNEMLGPYDEYDRY